MTVPPSLETVEKVPHGRTAQRLTWPHLPPAVRALVEERCGSPVVEAIILSAVPWLNCVPSPPTDSSSSYEPPGP